MTTVHISKRVVNLLLILFLAVIPVGTANSASTQPDDYRYADGVVLAAKSMIPVFHVNTPLVTGDGALLLSENLSGVYSRNNPPPQEDLSRGHPRFSMVNQTNNTLMEQFGATGGFYAFNPTRAFGIGNPAPELAPDKAQLLACQLLLLNPAFVPPAGNLQIPGLSVQCDHDFNANPLYQVSTETLSGQSSTPGSPADPDVPLRIQVTVPINIDIGAAQQLLIPLGGPGGHISMIFDDTSQNSPNPSLDDSVVGLQGLAMPAFGRSFDQIMLLPAINPADAQAQVLSQIKAAFPDATNIVVPVPALEYYVSDAGAPQTAMEPDLSFIGITLTLGDQTLTLKELVLPGVVTGPGGLGPTVTIDSPKNGATFVAGIPVTLQGSISDGTAPYTYDWQLDDGTSLMAGPGTAPGAGSLPPLVTAIPEPELKNSFGVQVIHLVVTDNDGITREALVTLKTPGIYMPFISKAAALTLDAGVIKAATQPSLPLLAPAKAPTGNYTFGVEYGSDYPPYGPGGSDLGGVPPDANGLSTGFFALGWPRVFNWYNQNAWEKDWRDCSLGGIDCSLGVDRADFVYYSGHGSDGTLYMPNNSKDSSWVNAIQARFQNARWVGFSSCLTLRAQGTPGAEPIRRWFNSFQGAHMLLGFNSVMADIAYGPVLMENMRRPIFFPWAQRTIAEAWVQTAFEMNAGRPAYIWATSTTVDPIGNKLPQVTDPLMQRPFPANWFYWVWWNT